MSKFIIEVRTKGFGKLETELKKATVQTRSFAREANNAKDAGATFRKEVSQLRNNMLLYTFAIGGAITGLGRFIMAASDAREMTSQFRVVFGDFAEEADAFAGNVQNSFGIAKAEMIELLAGLQDTFVPLGFSREQASKLSMSIAQLSLDVGSFKKLATGDVASRFTSALIGNHEAVRELGISLTEATIKQEALSLGIIKANEQMTQEAKILGRMSLLFKGTGDAQGDLTRTQQEFANRLKATTGQLQTLAIDIGNFVMPLGRFALGITNLVANFRTLKAGLAIASIALAGYAVKAALATRATLALSAAAKRNIFIAGASLIAMGIEIIATKMGLLSARTEEAAVEIEPLDKLVKDLAASQLDLSGGTNAAAAAQAAQNKALKEANEALEKSETGLAVRLAMMQEDTELGKARERAFIAEGRVLSDVEVELLKQIDAIIAAKKQKEEDLKVDKDRLDIMNAIAQVNQEAILIQAELDGANELQIEKMKILDKTASELADALDLPYKDLVGKVTESTDALSLDNIELQNATEEQKALAQQIVDRTNKTIELASANFEASEKEKEHSQSMKDSSKVAQQEQRSMQLLAGSIIAVAGALKRASDESMTFEQKMSLAMQTIGGILMAIPGGQVGGAFLQAGSMFVGHTGGLIKNNGIQRFATGGMVQGQDNIPIMAQAGEFIMQRSAVQNIGVDNLAAMNSGQSSGGLTINIQGNMVGDKAFVRDIMVPEIKKSMNRA